MLAKAEEIKIFEAAVKKLGKDSYLGPALAALIPYLESDMRSDIEPDLKGYIDARTRELDDLTGRVDAEKAKLKDVEDKLTAKNRDLYRLMSEIDRAKESAKKLTDELSERVSWLRHYMKEAA